MSRSHQGSLPTFDTYYASSQTPFTRPSTGGYSLLNSPRRLSIRPPTLSPAPTNFGTYVRVRGRRSKVLIVVGATIFVVCVLCIAVGSSKRGVGRLSEVGGFGLDVMGREEESKKPGATRLPPIEVKGGLSRICLLFPWRSECQEEAAKTKDPFALYHYTETGGRLYYPGKLIPVEQERGARLPKEPAPQPHPIHLLIRRAKAEWADKVRRQSQDLPSAVQEYERRYGRRPPRGFDEWFQFAKANDFVLIDEFDALDKVVTQFLAIKPSRLRERHAMLQFDEEFWLQDKTFTVEVKGNGKHRALYGPMRNANERPEQMLKLLGGIAKYLPDMNVTFTGHDQPWVRCDVFLLLKNSIADCSSFADRSQRRGQTEAPGRSPGREGYASIVIFLPRGFDQPYSIAVLDDEEAEETLDNWDYDGWAVVCPPGSALRDVEPFDDRVKEDKIYEPPKMRSFISNNHTAAMDACEHPEMQLIHGFTSWSGPRPGRLFPIFSSTSSSMHSDLLIPPIDQYDRRLGNDPEWDDKKYDKVVWRGTTTGADLNVEHMRNWSQRPRLCRLPFEPGSLVLPYAPSDTATALGPLSEFSARSQALAQEWFDFKFLGSAKQCDDPAVCEEFSTQFVWDDWMEPEEQNEYKYVIDVDGNGWSGRFHR
ncbi:SPOSA6832_01136, partial [Sporobolomyces salmonicolor]